MKRKNLLLRPPVLVVMVALLLAVSGVLYAHWNTSLNLDGQVSTGGIGVGWYEAWTNDDGVSNDDGELTTYEVWDGNWGDGSSADPKIPGLAPDPGDRYDKDVAACYATADGGSNLNVQIWNAYPSYHCFMTALLGGSGGVPVRATTTNLAAVKGGFCGFFFQETEDPYFGDYVAWDDAGPFGDPNNNQTFDESEPRLEEKCSGREYDMDVRWDPEIPGRFAFGLDGGLDELEGDISEGVLCGTQVDPIRCWWVRPNGNTYDGPMVGDDQGNWFVDVDTDDGGYNPSIDGPMLTQECDLLDTMETSGWIHVLQPASQNSWYQWNLTQDYVNWNEWEVGMCAEDSWVDFDGDPETFADVCFWTGAECVNPNP